MTNKKLVLIGLVVVGSLSLCGCDVSAINNMAGQQVAKDFSENYEIAKRAGVKTDMCVQAMFVSSMYLQSKDEPNYLKWKAIEKQDCKAAGMPVK